MSKNKSPIISIITVVFNGARELRATIESIAPQLNDDVEYIIIDGGSKDGTLDIINEYAKYITIWVSEHDEGIYHAMNKGLNLSTGDFIWFLNAGDEIADGDILSDLIKGINSDVNYIFSNTHLIDEFGNIKKTTSTPKSLDIKLMTTGMHVSHQSFLARKSIAPQYDIRYKLVADQKWVMECITSSEEKWLRFPRPIARYLLGGISERKAIACIGEKKLMIRENYPNENFKNTLIFTTEQLKAHLKAFQIQIRRLLS